jgi:sulfoxide reductase heme-binding subunit YedZ
MRRVVKPLIFALSLAPLAWLVRRALSADLGVNPAETLQLQTGLWSLRFLLVTLAITPVRRVTGWHRIIQYRRMLGLFAFFYAVLHALTWIVLDQYFDLDAMVHDVVKRPFITAGMTAFLLMIPLAATSTKGWIRRLGRRWQMLHRLIYVSGAAAALHFVWKVKVAIGEPVYYAAIVALLLAFRLAWYLRPAGTVRRQPARA